VKRVALQQRVIGLPNTTSKSDSVGSVFSSNHSYATAGWYDLEPSDDSDVVYSLSSSDDDKK